MTTPRTPSLAKWVPLRTRIAVKDFTTSARRAAFYRRCAADSSDSAKMGNLTASTDATLVIVTFNEPQLTAWQLEKIDRYYVDSHVVVIADNSSDHSARIYIRKAAHDHGALYFSLPRNPSTRPSVSHGLALNWIWRNVVTRSESAYIGILDHDIFPIQPVSYRTRVAENGSFGHVRRHGDFWFYWPGFSFFHRDFFAHGVDVDFLPHTRYGDTGAGNWVGHYSRAGVSAQPCDVSALTTTRLQSEKDGPSVRPQEYVLFDRSWVHLGNGSNWEGGQLSGIAERVSGLAAILNRPVEGL